MKGSSFYIHAQNHNLWGGALQEPANECVQCIHNDKDYTCTKHMICNHHDMRAVQIEKQWISIKTPRANTPSAISNTFRVNLLDAGHDSRRRERSQKPVTTDFWVRHDARLTTCHYLLTQLRLTTHDVISKPGRTRKLLKNYRNRNDRSRTTHSLIWPGVAQPILTWPCLA